MADRNATRKYGKRETRCCVVCGAAFTAPPSKAKRTCGVVCGKTLAARIGRERGGTPRGYCKGCHAEMWLTMCGGARRAYCTRACGEAHSKTITAECLILRDWGRRAARLQRDRAASARDTTPKANPYARECIVCGSRFTAPAGFGRPRVTCCDQCEWVHGAPGRRAHRAARRARMRARERFDPRLVFVRDGWTCQFCGISTPESKRGTHDHDAPELDHIVAVSRGGQHSMANTQCLCRACNQFKAAHTLNEMVALLAA